jgi:imidazoleglycerol phosphate synthase cyclase subunit
MILPRLIPVLFLKNGLVVRSQRFSTHQAIGNPMSSVLRYTNWQADELIILDISRDDRHDLRRNDLQQQYDGSSYFDVLKQIADVCHVPLTLGGRVRSLQDIERRLMLGADRVTLNTAAVQQPDLIDRAVRAFGGQCMVVSVDVLRHDDDRLEVFTDGGRVATGRDPVEWSKEIESRGAGEILLNSIDRDGTKRGYDLEQIRSITRAVGIPVIACGGVRDYEDFATVIREAGASAAAAGNIFHFFELSYPIAKKATIDAGVPLRECDLESAWFPREPVYDVAAEDARIAARLERARSEALPRETPRPAEKITWCERCCYPTISAAPIEFNAAGVCTGCQQAEVKLAITQAEWDRRRDLMRDTLEQYRCRDGSRHDCVIAVSGGKDSWFQIHVIKNEFGLNPLLVTYDGNNWTPAGWRNMLRMKEVFGCDHVIYSPSIDVLKKLNRLGFDIMGDMNWHAHVGITTIPARVAVQHKIPMVVWGEHGYLDMGGQFTMDDYPEMTYRDRLEHFARGYEWNYFVGREGLTAGELTAWQYPSDKEIMDLGLRGLYVGNFNFWEANDHIKLVTERYGFESSDEPFERTYRRMSNLDDMHENGVHDYLKFIKFGYGRGTDHVSKDIRAGVLGRGQGLELIRQYDHVRPSDIQRWLDYVGMSEDRFDRVADTFRDPRVWWRENDQWCRQTMDEASPP